MKTKSTIIAICMIFASLGVVTSSAQTRRSRPAPARRAVAQPTTAVSDPVSLLPTADVVALVNVKRVLNDAFPLFFSDDQLRLTQINAEILKFKSQTGIDARSFDRVAIGMRLTSPRPGITTADSVAIASGTFDSGAIVAAGRLAAAGKYEEQNYNGATIYIFNAMNNVKVFGLLDTRISKLAVCALDRNTLAIGEPEMVKAVLDGGRQAGRNAELIAMASQTPNAFMSFGANVPADIGAQIPIANDEVTKSINSIRQVYGAMSIVAGTSLDMVSAAKTHNADEAQSLNDTLGALKQFGAMLVGQLKPDKSRLAQNALDNLRIEKAGDEVRISLSIPRSDIATLMRSLKKKA